MVMAIVLLLIGAVIATGGDIVLKKWALTNSYWLFGLGLFAYLVGVTFLAFSFKYENIAVASVIFVVLNIALLSLVSWIYFKEPLSVMQIGGILVGVVAIVLLEYGKH